MQYPCFHHSISMLFGLFFGLFGRKKSVIFPPVLQCSDGQSVAEWARIAYLRTDFLAWISFVNKLTICALHIKWRMKNEEWRMGITLLCLNFLVEFFQISKSNSYSSFFILHSSLLLRLAQIVENHWYLTVGKCMCSVLVASLREFLH